MKPSTAAAGPDFCNKPPREWAPSQAFLVEYFKLQVQRRCAFLGSPQLCTSRRRRAKQTRAGCRARLKSRWTRASPTFLSAQPPFQAAAGPLGQPLAAATAAGGRGG